MLYEKGVFYLRDKANQQMLALWFMNQMETLPNQMDVQLLPILAYRKD